MKLLWPALLFCFMVQAALVDRVVYTGARSDTGTEGAIRADGLKAILIYNGTAVFTTSAGDSSTVVIDAANPTPYGLTWVTNELWYAVQASAEIEPGHFGLVNQLRRYSVSGNPPSSVSLLETKTLSTNTDSRIYGLYHSSSGATYCWLHYQTGVETPGGSGNWPKVFDTFYQNPSGIWTTNTSNFTIDATAQIESVCNPCPVLQHPTDGAIWSFYNRDSSHTIYAFRITESGGNYTVANTYTNLISSTTDGNSYGPDGELTLICAQASANGIVLSYPRYTTEFFTGGGWRGAQTVFATIDSSGGKTFLAGPAGVVVYSGIGDSPRFVIQNGTTYGIFRHILESPEDEWQPIQHWQYNGSWTLSGTNTACTTIGFVHQLPNNSGLYWYDCTSSNLHLQTFQGSISRVTDLRVSTVKGR